MMLRTDAAGTCRAAALVLLVACSGPDRVVPEATAPAAQPAPTAPPQPTDAPVAVEASAPRAPERADDTADLRPAASPRPEPPVPGAQAADDLIEKDERHFQHLWKLTSGGENAEAYWSFAGDRLVLQRRNIDERIMCDRIYATHAETGALEQLSDGRGATTCAYFLPGDQHVVYASTGGVQEDCPTPPDLSQGYVWAVHPEFDIYVHDLETGAVRAITDSWGYDAEATVSPLGDRMVFTSTRSGDLELWTCDLDGGNVVQVTDSPGYDGGAFFSHDGKSLVFRATVFTPGRDEQELSAYRRLLAEWKVRPSTMEIFTCDVDGSNRRQVTKLGQANFAPYFTPDDQRILFSSNHHVGPRDRNFDLFLIGADGEGLERVTTYEGFDAFPMFSPDGKWLAFSSNRGGAKPGETNVFIALWRE